MPNSRRWPSCASRCGFLQGRQGAWTYFITAGDNPTPGWCNTTGQWASICPSSRPLAYLLLVQPVTADRPFSATTTGQISSTVGQDAAMIASCNLGGDAALRRGIRQHRGRRKRQAKAATEAARQE